MTPIPGSNMPMATVGVFLLYYLCLVGGEKMSDRGLLNPALGMWSADILLTALGSEANVAKGLALGADAYITKPFSNSEVIAKVRELLEDRA